LNVALVAGWVWTELLPRGWLVALWSGVGLLWFGASAVTWWGAGSSPSACIDDDSGAEHRQALEHYLGGRCAEAELCWKRMLRQNPEDCDALMQLATLYHRQGRTAEAARALDACRRRDVRGKWNWEISRAALRVASGESEA
jgi:tetratricopeptide (TPR) repeat protein